ncbi:MAG: NAD-dependent epimerase/dehydratase family protein [Phycisphaeraceae bacterium]
MIAKVTDDCGPTLITGGAGFIGTNVAHRLLSAGTRVRVFDNLAREGVEQNLAWLQARHRDRLEVQIADVRDELAVRHAVRDAAQVYHFAAQVAVTTSLQCPVDDFDVNARGTLNVLEALRERPDPPPLLFTSTNKVYGQLDGLGLRAFATRYRPTDAEVRRQGIAEQQLAFHSPYGCSKGAADQYVLDYARSFGLPTVVFRMSCIYGPHQCGCEDQGWVAHFVRTALAEGRVTVYGDGRQVRDVLFVEDLVEAMTLAMRHVDRTAGQAFNIGGGPSNTLSLLELIELVGRLHGRVPTVDFDRWRPGDQRYYVSDMRRYQALTGWRPRVTVREGVARLYAWLGRSAPRLHVDGSAPTAV